MTVDRPVPRRSGEVRAALRALVDTPERCVQVLGVAAFVVTSWLFVAIRVFRSVLPRGSVEETLADVTAGGVDERWHSFYVAIFAWGHIPATFAILLVGTGLAVHSWVHAWRLPLDEVGRVPEDAHPDPDRSVPPLFMFFVALVCGNLAFGASSHVSPTPGALFWEDDHSVAQWAALGWWAVALATAAGGVARALRSRRIRRRWQGTPEADRAVRARRAAVERALSGGKTSFVQLAGAQRAGRGHLFNNEERERIGAGASAWAIVALFSGMFGLGPVGLVAGALAWRGQRSSIWVGTLGMVLSAVQTGIIVVALVLAIATG